SWRSAGRCPPTAGFWCSGARGCTGRWSPGGRAAASCSWLHPLVREDRVSGVHAEAVHAGGGVGHRDHVGGGQEAGPCPVADLESELAGRFLVSVAQRLVVLDAGRGVVPCLDTGDDGHQAAILSVS